MSEQRAEYVAIEIRHEEGTWWCDSPHVPGFTGAADTRDELIERSRTAIEEILAEDGKRLGTFVWMERTDES